ncbi:adenosine deaminase, variant [Cladophialophora immunda]|uniref:Adenine deaminase n=1 Tax=Cladophialophora immunda TaxID=569365 RepID=A0A0D1ZSR3_9EURO|nr:adenosine deaminase [Cladophialophora immunda]XP_016251307.1 adenosine deaminase, variant [Cladophialophora immunda]KIW31090.1 adenosine deaminase [Cladophialophora immunda]KIW31091.1 adenosine deaminase, variant [Cladophialophora immunda]
MCQGHMHEFLKALPKCEHHMHLEGSLEPSLLFDLAARNNISLPSPAEDPSFESIDTLLARYQRFTSLDDFLHYYFIGMSVLVTPADFEALAYEYFRRAHRDGVVHAEVFFDPQAHTSRGVAYAAIVDGFAAAQRRARADFAITSELIVCVLRHLPVEDGARMYRDAIPHLESGVVRGLGLSSTEKGNPPHLYRDIYADAAARGFRRTAHAGEEAGVDYMASALHHLDVMRVDHGIKLPEDAAVMALFAQRGIMVTMCPLSNVELRCVPTVAALPIRTYLDNGVRFSINSDDPAYFGGYVLDNHCAVQDAFGLDKKEWERIAGHAIDGSWCSDERKAELRKHLEDVMVRFQD